MDAIAELGAEARAELADIYAEAEAAVRAAGPRCDASGRCCRFTEYGHTLFLSHLEAQLLLESAPPYQGPVTRDGCPFQVGGLCTARESRPLGCRIYFCDESYQDTGNAITERALARLKALADRLDLGWRYAPLHLFLNDPAAPSVQSGRVALPVVAPRTGDTPCAAS